jgi:DNA helicase HerA-like ATPase
MSPSVLPAEVKLLEYRVLEVPRVPEIDGWLVPAVLRSRMLATVALAGSAGRPLVVAWVRRQPHGRLDVLAGGGAYLRGDGGSAERIEIPLPLGAIARTLKAGQGARSLDAMAHWIRCQARFDPLSVEESPTPGSSLEDFVGLMADRPIGWLVVARPVARRDAQARLDDLSSTVADLHMHRDSAGAERLALERAESELRYLERWSALGFWQLDVWVGSDTAGRAAAAASLLTSSSDVAGLPFRLRTEPIGVAPAETTEAPWSAPFVTTAETVAALTRPPARELPGLRTVTPSTFDITPESRGSVELGQVLDATLHGCGPFGVEHGTLNRHVFVSGATGSGKSQTVRRLLDCLTKDDVPWLVVEPAKAEYARMAARVSAPVTVIRLGDPAQPPAKLNPLEPTSAVVNGVRVTFPLQTHVDLVRALFTASFEATEPFPQILAASITRAYEELGWNLALGRTLSSAPGVVARYPTLGDLQRVALDVVEGVGYGPEVRDNVRGFVKVRIDSLRLGAPGRFFESGHPLDLEALIGQNVVLEIQDVGDDNDKAFLIGTVIIRVYELLRLTRQDVGDKLLHVLVLEEAHRLLRNSEPGSVAARAVEMFADLLAEVRAYGEGIVVAEQIPAKIIPDVVKNSALKIMHRLPALDDREFVGSTMNLTDEQSEMVVALGPGRAAVHAAGMDRPVLVDVDGSGLKLERATATFAPVPISCRSPACPAWCASTPCTLDELEVAAVIAADAELRVWVEVSLAAHLLGDPMPAAASEWIGRIRTLGTGKRVGCAVGQLVEDAIRSRWVELQEFFDPAQLARHLSEALFAQLGGRGAPCQGEPHWQAGEFRWRDVVRALKIEAPGDDRESQHPLTSQWRARGLDLKGATWLEQLGEARAAAPTGVPFTTLLMGQPNRVDDAASALSTAKEPAARLTHALNRIGVRSRWAVHYLGERAAGSTWKPPKSDEAGS